LVLVDSSRLAYRDGSVYEQRYHPAGPLLAQVRDLVLARELAPPATDGVEGARDRIAALEAELGARLSAAQRATAAEAQLAAQRLHLQRLERELGEAERERDALQAELEKLRPDYEWAQKILRDITSSASWRMTEPLRGAKRFVRPRPR
jgi:DNA repair exonuclease SbcCD ATPase subunit